MPCYRIPFESIVHWPYLDFGNLGVEKQFVGFDLVATAPEGVSISVGYDQNNIDSRTDAFDMDGDTLPGRLIPIPVAGPSFDLKLVFAAEQLWELDAAVVYVQDMRRGT